MLNQDRPFLISPPFGRYFRERSAYSVLGSYTVDKRTGRLLQILRTVRPVPGGWINKIGLRNPGLDSFSGCKLRDHQIISIAPIYGDTQEWAEIINWISCQPRPYRVELNISCPNTDHAAPDMPRDFQLKKLLAAPLSVAVIFKLQPLPGATATALALADAGAKYIHLSNTIPCPVGGISGAPLREVNLPLVEATANALAIRGHHDVEVGAGGGIYRHKNLLQYRDAGATRFSMSTAWAWPPRARRIIRAEKQHAELAAAIPRPSAAAGTR